MPKVTIIDNVRRALFIIFRISVVVAFCDKNKRGLVLCIGFALSLDKIGCTSVKCSSELDILHLVCTIFAMSLDIFLRSIKSINKFETEKRCKSL